MKKSLFAVAALLFVFAGCTSAGIKSGTSDGTGDEPKGPAFLGVSMTAANDLKPLSGVTAKHGVQIHFVVPDSSADRAGMQPGDIIVAINGPDFDSPADKVVELFRDELAKYLPGDTVRLKIIRETPEYKIYENGKKLESPERIAADLKKHLQEAKYGTSLSLEAVKNRRVLTFEVTLMEKPMIGEYVVPSDSEIHPELADYMSDVEKLVEALVRNYGIAWNYNDLRGRLRKLEEKHEGFRIPEIAYIHRNPFHMEKVASDICLLFSDSSTDTVSASFGVPSLSLDLFGLKVEETSPAPLQTGLSLEGHLDQLAKRLESAAALHEKAFAALSEEDRKFIFDNIERLGEVFEEQIYIHTNDDRDEFQKHLRLIELARKIDLASLFLAFQQLREIASPDFAKELENDLKVAGVNIAQKIIAQRETSFGKIIIGGTADNWYMDVDAAIIIDLGGTDFYTNNSGSSTAEIPCAVLVDVRGNDAYESTRSFAQGSGLLGIGILADLSGDDSYVGLRWCQGTCAYGIGALLDAGGNDSYRSHGLAQGAAMWGIAMLADTGGNDRYESHVLAQGVGMCGGIGVLCETRGDDRYYAKGTYPTGYGTPGVYEGWSQGCGVGFRQYGSGGIGVLIDVAGADRFEAGNFSQGGGYYYGWGIFNDRGREDDTYIGSRYAQGFCAHQALGTFIEHGGNDTYVSRHAVHAGLAWDECVTLFIDRAGDDNYSCENGFSQCASAHNAICIFIDEDGKDVYATGPGPGCAGPNNYHDGTSLSFFADLGGGEDAYRKRVENNSVRYEPEDSFCLDLPMKTLSNIDEILKLAEPYKKPEEKPKEESKEETKEQPEDKKPEEKKDEDGEKK